MPKKWMATYEGPTRPNHDSTRTFIIPEDDVELIQDNPTEVSEELAKELQEGSDRLAHHRFTVEQVDEPAKQEKPTVTDAGGPGGTSGAGAGDSSPTTTAASR